MEDKLSVVKFLEMLISYPSNFIWGYILIYTLIPIGVIFTIMLGFAQFRRINHMFALLKDSKQFKSDKVMKVTSLQAFFLSASSRIGTGNIVGVSIAVVAGGPGAVFWMWVIALFGAASSFVESTLAQLYKTVDKKNGNYIGGPAYYMRKGLNSKFMSILFAILITITYGFAFNSVQSNTIATSFASSFHINASYTSIVISVVAGVIIFGGLKSIVKATQLMVPFMASLYLLMAIYILLINITELPMVLKNIFYSAFGIKQVASGVTGYAISVVIMNGVKRGLFSNEAGMGSAPNAAATANVSHPVKQGFIQALGVFFDTIVVCSATAFIVLLSKSTDSNLEGIQLTQSAVNSFIMPFLGNIFLPICILLFAFSSILGNYYYGESNILFITDKRIYLKIYRIGVCTIVFAGGIVNMQLIWNIADLFMGLMAIVNLIAIVILAPVVLKLYKDYIHKLQNGKELSFKLSDIDNVPGGESIKCWD